MRKFPCSPTFNVASLNTNIKAFTLIELMLSVAVTSILAAIAIPNYSDFIVQMRVDSEISKLHRILFLTRNAAINNGQKAIVCPLNLSNQCTTLWHNELSVFVDVNDNEKFDDNERIVSIRAAINTGDKLLYGIGRNKITFKPTGHLSGLANGTFRYCPQNHMKLSRGIVVARSGRFYQSTDIDNDGLDENRGNKEISCDN
ncbi:MAG: GspH/FimT family pseudopilin [Colwellia sp.]|nr:GspH/FimT family pseudopilin [Colwellia sp.]